MTGKALLSSRGEVCMLCPTCPMKFTCKEACPDLIQELKKFEKGPFKGLRSPQGIEKLQEIQAEQKYYVEDYPLISPAEEPTDVDVPLNIQCLMTALQSLTGKQYQCIQLYYWEDLSQNKIGEWLGVTRQTVSQHLEYAYSKLRREYLVELAKTTCPLTSVLVRGPDLRCA